MEENLKFCIKCGQKLNSNAVFCTKCGAKQENVNETTTDKIENSDAATKTLTFAENLAQNNKIIPFFKKVGQKVGDFIRKNKIPLLAGVGVIILAIVGISIYNAVHDFTKIAWDQESGDVGIDMTEAGVIHLKVIATDKEEQPITEIRFETTDGSVRAEGASVIWTLPEENGEYTLEAIAPSGKKISKTIKKVKLEQETLGGLEIAEIDDSVADNDGDGLTNAREKELGTNPESADTDRDGLSDKYELEVSKTDPLKSDTDNDGLRDGDELDLGLNPLMADSKGDGVRDGEREVTVEMNDAKNGASLKITGKGNIASTVVDRFNNTTFEEMTGIMDTIYTFTSDGEIKSAKVTISYDPQEITKNGLKAENLTLYYFNDDTKELEKVPTTVDAAKHQLTAELTHFSKYVIGDQNLATNSRPIEVMFVIDNSISMYNAAQIDASDLNIKYVGDLDLIGNDVDFKRLALTNQMIDRLVGDYSFGVAEFSGNYKNLYRLDNDKTKAKSAVSGMREHWQTSPSLNGGTNIVSALESGISEFKDEKAGKYLVLLTDGQDTTGKLENKKDELISNAEKNSVKVCIVGLGNKVDYAILQEIATATGCKYYSAGNTSVLDEIYSLMSADINYNYVDTDGDGEVDGMISADSGFITGRDGFSFENYISDKSTEGHCYGLAAFAKLRYMGELPETMGYLDVNNLWRDLRFHRDFSAQGYDLKNTYFAGNGNLYDFQFTTAGLKVIMGGLPADYRDRIEDDTWWIKQEYADAMEQAGFNFTIKDRKKMFADEPGDFSKYQSATLQEESSLLSKNATRDEVQLLTAVWRLFITQLDSQKISFSSNPDKAFETLNQKLDSGNPEIISINNNHAINATRLIQDNQDGNKFKLEVYDNNYPGEVRYIEMERSKYNKMQLNFTAWTNEYNYTFYYDHDNDGEVEETPVSIFEPVLQ